MKLNVKLSDFHNLHNLIKNIESTAWDTLKFTYGTSLINVLNGMKYDVLREDKYQIGDIEIIDNTNKESLFKGDVKEITQFNDTLNKALKVAEGNNYEIFESSIKRGQHYNTLILRVKRRFKDKNNYI